MSNEVAVNTSQRIRFTNTNILDRLSAADRTLLALVAEVIRTHRAIVGDDKKPLTEMLADAIFISGIEFPTPEYIRRCLGNARCALMNHASNLKAERYIRAMVKHARVDEDNSNVEKAEAILCFYEAFTYAALLNLRERVNKCVDSIMMTGHEYYALNAMFGRIKVLAEAEPEFVMMMGEEVALIPRYIP